MEDGATPRKLFGCRRLGTDKEDVPHDYRWVRDYRRLRDTGEDGSGESGALVLDDEIDEIDEDVAVDAVDAVDAEVVVKDEDEDENDDAAAMATAAATDPVDGGDGISVSDDATATPTAEADMTTSAASAAQSSAEAARRIADAISAMMSETEEEQ